MDRQRQGQDLFSQVALVLGAEIHAPLDVVIFELDAVGDGLLEDVDRLCVAVVANE